MSMSGNIIVQGPSPASVGDPQRPNSRNIPEPMKRTIRQRCGFGCVICGAWPFQYDHMTRDWAEVKEHVESDITLLCPNHHQEKTGGTLPRADVIAANEVPYNLFNDNPPSQLLHYAGNTATATIATNQFISSAQTLAKGLKDHRLPYMIPLLIDSVVIMGFRFQDDHALLTLLLLNEYNEIDLKIDDNQLTFNRKVWDVERVGRELIVRRGPRDVALRVLFEPPDRINILRAKFMFNGVFLDLHERYLILNGERFDNFEQNFIVSPIGVSIGRTSGTERGVINFERVKRC